MLTHNSNMGNGDEDDDITTSYSPYVSVGCVMFPVFVLVWYRYSKQYCRSFGRDGCRHQDFERMNDDDYYSQQHPASSDGGADDSYSPMELTDRLVKWINRQNVFGFDGTTMEGDGGGAAHNNTKDCFCEDDLDGDLFWECIPHAQQATMELSSSTANHRVRQTPVVVVGSVAANASEAPALAVSDSAETKNSMVLLGATATASASR